MPTYRYRCSACGDFEEWQPIAEAAHQTHRDAGGDCDEPVERVFVPPYIAAAATPNRAGAPHILRTNRKDKELSADLDAYKRLRRDGTQPPGIDGCARLEQEAREKLEIEYGKKFPGKIAKLKSELEKAGKAGLSSGLIPRTAPIPR